MKVININNQKGGVGKTTTTITIGEILNARGNKVLLIDCDGSSATLTKVFFRQKTKFPYEPKYTLTDLVLQNTMGRDLREIKGACIYSNKNGLDIIPADTNLAAATVNLSMQNNLDIRFKTMKSILEQYKDSYDYILIDSAPVLDIFSLNQLIASDELIIVSQCQRASKEAIQELMQSVKEFVFQANPKLKVAGVLMTMFDNRTKYGKEIIDEMQNEKISLFKTIIPRSVKAERYMENTKTFPERNDKVYRAYEAFVNEYLGRL